MSAEPNIFALAVYHRERDRDVFNMFLCAAAAAVRGPPDEYEDPAAPTVGPCAGATRIHWAGHDWTVEDFLSLLADADANQRAAQYVLNPTAIMEEEGSSGVDYHEVALLVNNIQQQPYLRSIYTCPILSHVPSRDFLKHYLFWFAVQYDTRVARLACRINNMLLSHGLGCPTPSQNLALHDTLAHALPLYARGEITAPQFRSYVWDAYCFALRPHGTQGGSDEEMDVDEEEEISAGSAEDEEVLSSASEDSAPHCLFDVRTTRFRGTSSYFTLRKNALAPDMLAQHYVEAHRGGGAKK